MSSEEYLSVSPASVASPIFVKRKVLKPEPILLHTFINEIPTTVRKLNCNAANAEGMDDPVSRLFRRLHITKDEISRHAFIEQNKNYTRNLISTDHETYTLLLLCWNPTKVSPIHDHPCNGCWMRVLKGTVNEKRYCKSEDGSRLMCTSDCTFLEGQNTFIKDSLGYHRIGNEGEEMSMTLHLYSPPIAKCQTWIDEGNVSSITSIMCNFSEYGKKL